MTRLFPAAILALLLTAGPALADTPPGLTFENNVTYSTVGSVKLRMDIVKPGTPGPHPGILLIHGGSWRAGSKNMFQPFLSGFGEAGFVACAVQYRLSPKHKWPAHVDDVKAAVRWMRDNARDLDLDPKRIASLGFSAGGHLALMLGVMDEEEGKTPFKVQTVINWFGPTDLTKLDSKTVREFLGARLDEKPEVWKGASPLNHISPDDPPVLTLHGRKDRLVPVSQATRLHAALKKAKVESKIVLMDAGHGWGGKMLMDSLKQTKAFLLKHLGDGARAKKAKPADKPKAVPETPKTPKKRFF